MNARLTLILFLGFVALGIFAWTLRDAGPRQVGPNAPTPTPGPMWDITADGVSTLAVSGEGGAYVLTRAGDGWEVDGQKASEEVDGVVRGVAEPTVIRVLGEDRKPDDYGFATPALTLTLTVSDTARVLLVGDQPPTTSDYYVRPADGGPIRIVSGLDIDRLKAWLTAPPLAPTATPEASATPAEGEGEGEADAAAAEDGALGEGEAEATASDEAPEATPTGSTARSTTAPEPTSTPTAAPSGG